MILNVFLLLLSRKRARPIAVAIVKIAITIWEAIQEKSHGPICKTDTKNGAKRLRATTFAIAKLEEDNAE